jgi:hypothetical protein
VSRLRSDFFVAALLRRCAVEGVDAVLRRRGAAEAGAIFVKVDRLDGTSDLYGPAPQSMVEDTRHERFFVPVMSGVPPFEIEERIRRETRFDPDLFFVEIEDRGGRHFLSLSREGD